MLKEYSDRKGGRGDDTIKGTDLDSWKKETVEGMFYLVKPSILAVKPFLSFNTLFLLCNIKIFL